MPSKKEIRAEAKKTTTEGRKKTVSGATRAGITFPPARMMKLMRRDRLSQRMGKGASVYMAAIMDYIAHEITELSAEIAT